jgi:hypothetical protein
MSGTMLENTVGKKYMISFATVSMNRMHHIIQTLPKNIQDNESYSAVEFLLLDYNSSDGLEDWVKTNLNKYIESGLLKFYRTTEPEYFNRSHSRNMILKLAQGEIICNVDADNYTGKGFAKYINEAFNSDDNIFLKGFYKEGLEEYKDAYGRFCTWKKDFFSLNGYDEEMESYGHEDTDLYERMVRYGKTETDIAHTDFLHSISHSDQERTGNEFFRNNLYRFYLAYTNDDKTKVLFLYKNGTFEAGTLVKNYYSIPCPSSIEEQGWLKGKWKLEGSFLLLNYTENYTEKLVSDNRGLNYKTEINESYLYSHITNKTLLHNTMQNYSIITNSNRIHLNETKGKIVVNTEKNFGTGQVFKNFDYSNPITIN